MTIRAQPVLTVLVGVAALATASQSPAGAAAGPAGAGGQDRYRIGLVGRDAADPVYRAVLWGARSAAAELGPKNRVVFEIVARTPRSANSADTPPAEAQAAAFRGLVEEGVDALVLSPLDATKLKPLVDAAAAVGIPVITYRNDVPGSRRTAFVGIDEAACGRLAMAELARAVNGKGQVAVLAGDLNEERYRLRLSGVREVVDRHPRLKIHGVHACGTTASSAVEVLQRAYREDHHKEVSAWVFLGGWPLEVPRSLPWKQPGVRGHPVAATGVDAVPTMIPYIVSGDVEMVVAPDYSQLGLEAVRLAIDVVHLGLEHDFERVYVEVATLDRENLRAFTERWTRWQQRKPNG